MAAFDQTKFEALQGRVMGNVGGAVGLLLAYKWEIKLDSIRL